MANCPHHEAIRGSGARKGKVIKLFIDNYFFLKHTRVDTYHVHEELEEPSRFHLVEMIENG